MRIITDKLKFTLIFFSLFFLFGLTAQSFAQNGPVMYFCEKYDNGENGVDNRFHPGEITVIVRSEYALGLKDANLHIEKYNFTTFAFEVINNITFTVTPDKKYLALASKELSLDSPGIYKIYLFDNSSKVIASALVEIVK
jgi:hypothetical protein